MGLCVSNGPGNPSREETKMNVEIERNLQNLIKEEKKAKKVLLLGSAECGKSTLFKQMKIMHQNGYTPSEAVAYKDTIFLNLLESLQNVAAACLALKIPFQSPANQTAAEHLLTVRLDSPTAVEEFLQHQHLVKPLITDEAFQSAIVRRHEYLHLDSSFYWFDHVDRVLDQKEYVPTNDDILRSRVVTTGVIVTHFTHMQVLFQMYDVGGQRGERKKWIHCFDDVDAILFVSSLSEYDQVLREAPDANRLQESLTLFSGLISLPYFKKTQVILFLNKDDIFRTKVEQVDMGQYFPEYSGGCNYAAALDFIKFEFEKRIKEVGKEVMIYVTNATDTTNFMKIWNAVRKVIVMNRLRASGLVSED